MDSYGSSDFYKPTPDGNRRHWEHSRLRRQVAIGDMNPNGGASVRVDENGTQGAQLSHTPAYNMMAQGGSGQAFPVAGGSQMGSQHNLAAPRQDPMGQPHGLHIHRARNKGVGMAGELIKLAMIDKPSPGDIYGPQGSSAAGQSGASTSFIHPQTIPDTQQATPAALVRQLNKMAPLGGSLSTGNLYHNGPTPAALFRGSFSSPVPNSQGNMPSAGSAAYAAGSDDASSHSSGPKSTKSEPISTSQRASVEPTGIMGQGQAEGQYAGVGAAIQYPYQPVNGGAMVQHQENPVVAQYQPQGTDAAMAALSQQTSQLQLDGGAGTPQYHQQPGTLVPPVPAGMTVGPLPMQPVPEEVKQQRSAALNYITGPSGIPTLQDLFNPNNVPFMAQGSGCGPATSGVVVIYNTPFNVTQAEVKAFLGRSSRILNDADEPVHIMMDRITSKTYDVYVEFLTQLDAMNAVRRHNESVMRGRHPRLGHRHVDVKLSSQGDLLKNLFPIAKGVDWHTTPHGIERNSQWSWENFDGFFSKEEMNMIWKHVENPGRTPFASDCQERIYECMISTLKKLPWYMTDCITICQRHIIWDTTVKMIQHLGQKLQEYPYHDRLTPQLLNRLVDTAMRCPGFTVLQKDNIAFVMGFDEARCLAYNQPGTASLWRHQWGLTMKPGVPQDVVEFYIDIIFEETMRSVALMTPQRRQQLEALMAESHNHWGYFWAELAYPRGPVFDNMTLEEAAGCEWSTIAQILHRALCGGVVPQY
ncbi:hypothetical protein GGR52DRAFT_572260 [Hypoxylon sp. FL1284]|nr:hypothetical protein GGR52DRAFT_572260 [Hypoxylon sp. FL1284]